VFGVAVVAGAVWFLAGVRAPQPVRPEPPPEPQARIVTALPGSTIAEVFVAKGAVVKAGELLVRLRPRRTAISPETVDAAASLLRRMPPQTWQQLIASDPQLLRAEQEYVDAARAHERENSGANAARLRRALATRERAQQRLGRLGPAGIDAIATEYEQAVRDASAEVRAPCAGTIEIFDLHTGDPVPPSGRVALIAER
jgi:multidrug resistance efflux pump